MSLEPRSLNAARELYRYGYNNIHIFEATSRIGGRLWSEPATHHTAYELGAMRMPFFCEPEHENSALAFYASEFRLSCQPFPNPGTVLSGVYMADEKHEARRLRVWKKGEEDGLPKVLRTINTKWQSFASQFRRTAERKYTAGDRSWQKFWGKVVDRYGGKTFRQLTRDPLKQHRGGNFGGLGMTEHEADLFYVLGAGDGGWGAFYEVSALYVIRTMLFGFGDNLQLILGREEN